MSIKLGSITIAGVAESGITKQDVVDSLDSTDKEAPLSANMGRILYELIEQTGGGGTVPGNMEKFEAVGGNQKVSLYIKEPSDTVIDGETVCSVKGVKIMRKQKGYPQTENDGSLIVDIPLVDFGKYETNPYEDTGLESETTYYYAAFPYSDTGVFNRNVKNRAVATTTSETGGGGDETDAVIFGYRLDKNDPNTETRITYTDDCEGYTPAHMNYETGEFDYGSWGDSFIINSFRPVMLNYDGTVAYELNPNDYTKKLDGSRSEVDNINFNGNAMVEIKLMWVKRWEDENYEYFRVSDKKIDNTWTAYAHSYEDVVLDRIFMSMFECTLFDGKLRSISNYQTMTNKTAQEEITAAQNNGDGWYTDDFSNRKLIEDLLFLIGKSTDSQRTFGEGVTGETSIKIPGLLDKKGMFYGSTTPTGSLKSTDSVKVFHIENYWGNANKRTAGFILKQSGDVLLKESPPYNLTGEGYKNIGVSITPTTSGGIKETTMTKYGRFAKDGGGNTGFSGGTPTYIPDTFYTSNNNDNYITFGGSLYYGKECGISAFNANLTATEKNNSRSATLSFKSKIYALPKDEEGGGDVEEGTQIYGFKIDKNDSNPDTRVSYTDMAIGRTHAKVDPDTGVFDYGGWKDVWFVTGNKPVMMENDGTIMYELNPNDYTKKIDGTESDIENKYFKGNAMALFPTCWVKRWEDENYEYFQVCNKQLTDEFKAYAHQREDGSIMDWFARSIYDGSNDSLGKIRSFSGLKPFNTIVGDTVERVHDKGILWDCDTWSRISLIWDLLRLMSCSTDVQKSYGYGYCAEMSNGNDLKECGAGNKNGQFYGTHKDDVVKVFHIENFWGNISKFALGLKFKPKISSDSTYYIKMTRPYNKDGLGYETISTNIDVINYGYQSKHEMSEYGLLPKEHLGSETTYIPDGFFCGNNENILYQLRFGGNGGDMFFCGCEIDFTNPYNATSWKYGVALTCEQPKEQS